MGTECSKVLDSLPAEPPGNPQSIVTRDFNKAFNTNCNKRMIWLFSHSWRQMKASQEPSGSWGTAFQREWTQLEHTLFVFPLSWTPFSITWKELVAAAAILDHEATWRMEGTHCKLNGSLRTTVLRCQQCTAYNRTCVMWQSKKLLLYNTTLFQAFCYMKPNLVWTDAAFYFFH